MTNSVTVVGEVNRLGSLTFNGSFAYEDYLELAAGTTDRSSRKDIYVIKANGKVVFPSQNGMTNCFAYGADIQKNIESGGTILVPINQQFQRPLSLYREVSTVIFQTIVPIASLIAIGN